MSSRPENKQQHDEHRQQQDGDPNHGHGAERHLFLHVRRKLVPGDGTAFLALKRTEGGVEQGADGAAGHARRRTRPSLNRIAAPWTLVIHVLLLWLRPGESCHWALA